VAGTAMVADGTATGVDGTVDIEVDTTGGVTTEVVDMVTATGTPDITVGMVAGAGSLVDITRGGCFRCLCLTRTTDITVLVMDTDTDMGMGDRATGTDTDAAQLVTAVPRSLGRTWGAIPRT
jgi:hypothetical protein